MVDWLARMKAWLGHKVTSDAEREWVEKRLRDQQLRIARIDAGLPVPRRSDAKR